MDIQDFIKRAGGCRRVAEVCGVHFSAVCRWKQIPDRHLVAIERELGFPREKLRPDLFVGVTVTRPKKG